MNQPHFIGQSVKVVAHTVEPDLYRCYGKVIDIGVSHTCVRFTPDMPPVWIQSDLVIDAGRALS